LQIPVLSAGGELNAHQCAYGTEEVVRFHTLVVRLGDGGYLFDLADASSEANVWPEKHDAVDVP